MHAEPVPALVAFLLGTIAVARATRLVVHDDFPPIEALRLRWSTLCANHPRLTPWESLLSCGFCFAPYAAAVDLAWAVSADVPGGAQNGFWAFSWWCVNVWAAVAYLASSYVVRDEPPED